MPKEPVFRRRPDFLYEPLEDEALVYYPGASRAVAMSRSAETVWMLCEGGASPTQIKAKVNAQFAASGDSRQIGMDVDIALFELVEAGALIVEPDGAHRIAGITDRSTSPDVIPRYTRRPDFVHEVLDDEVLLYFPGSLRAVRLSSTAAMIWSLCDDASAAEITSLLEEAYPGSAEQIARDVDATLTRLQECGALARTAG